MSPAARELALIGYAKQREPILAQTRRLRAALGMKPHPALAPPLILCLADRL